MRVNAEHLRIGLRVHEARKSVARIASNALAGVGVLLVELYAERACETAKSRAVRNRRSTAGCAVRGSRRVGIRSAGRRIGRILAALSVHVVRLLGLACSKVPAHRSDGPGRRDSAVMLDLCRSPRAEAGRAPRHRISCCRQRSSWCAGAVDSRPGRAKPPWCGTSP